MQRGEAPLPVLSSDRSRESYSDLPKGREPESLPCFGTEYLDTEYSIPKYSAPR